MSHHEVSSALDAGVARRIDELARPRLRPELRDAGGAIAAAAAVVFIEIHLAGLGHGTHMLALLLVVLVVSFAIGPRGGALGLVLGSIGSLAASWAGLTPDEPWPEALVAVVLALALGAGGLSLQSVAVRMRRHWPGVPEPPPLRSHGDERLTGRELQVLRYAAAGMTIDEIAELLVISTNTVKTHVSHAYQKLGARNRTEAIRAALDCGCLTTGDLCCHVTPVPADDALIG